MDLKFLPEDYPTVYSTEYDRWVDEDFYETIDTDTLRRINQTLSYNFNEECVLVFISQDALFGIEDSDGMKYHIYYIEFGEIEGDIFIHNFTYINSTNAPPSFIGEGNYAAKEIKRQKTIRNYQQYERFYVGEQTYMSHIKDCIREILSNAWHTDDAYVPF
tara:strand:+ start:684 stop:1166 length:483 start_codon:yes stop_codon:yes gene_type:complete